MNRINILKRVLACILICATVMGITVVHMQKSKASDVDDLLNSNGIATRTLDKYWDTMSGMSVEEFEEVFMSEEYKKEFTRHYDMVKRGESKLDKLKEKISGISDKYIDMVTDTLFEKLPKLVKDKFKIDKTKIKTMVSTVVSFLNDSDVTVKVIVAAIATATGLNTGIITTIVDIVIKVLYTLINKDTDGKPTDLDAELPSEIPVDLSDEPIVSEQPSLEPSSEPLAEITSEPTDIPSATPNPNELFGDGEIDENDGGILNCPPQIEPTIEPTDLPIETEVPAA